MDPTILKSPWNPRFPFSVRSSLKPKFPIQLKPPFTKRSLRPLTLASKIRSNGNPNPMQTVLTTVLKPASIAAIAVVAVFLSRHPAAAVAAPPVDTQSKSISSDIDEESVRSQLRANPDDISALRSLIELKVKSKQLKQLPEASRIVDKLIELEPGEHDDLLRLKSLLLSYYGDSEAAKLGFEEILKKNPCIVEAYHGLVQLAYKSLAYQRGDDSDVGEIIKRVESMMVVCKKEGKKEELKEFKLLAAQVRVINGKYVEALKIYKELVKEEPRDFRPYLCQGIIHTFMKNEDEAEKHFEKYGKLVPKGHFPYGEFWEHWDIAFLGMGCCN